MNKELKSSEDWSKECPDIIILDPDGWDRTPEGWDKSWNELISREEFNRRVCYSTCQFTPNFFSQIIASNKKVLRVHEDYELSVGELMNFISRKCIEAGKDGEMDLCHFFASRAESLEEIYKLFQKEKNNSK